MSEVAKETYFDEKAIGNKNTRNNTLIKLLKSPAIMASEVCTIQKITKNYVINSYYYYKRNKLELNLR